MELKEAILGRRSIRRFTDKEVPREIVLELLRLASWAPSANNRQQWFFYAIHQSETKDAIAQAIDARIDEIENWSDLPDGVAKSISWMRRYGEMIRQAPWLVAVCQEISPAPFEDMLIKRGFDRERLQHWRPNARLQSVAAAVQNFLLAAHDHGLGAVWMVGPLFAVEEVEKILGVLAGRRVVTLVSVGYPAESPDPPERKAEEDTWCFM